MEQERESASLFWEKKNPLLASGFLSERSGLILEKSIFIQKSFGFVNQSGIIGTIFKDYRIRNAEIFFF